MQTLPRKQLHCRSSESFVSFTFHGTMPFLNCIEHNNQYQLVQLIPKLFADLKTGVFVSEGLRNFHVLLAQVVMDKQELVSELNNYLMTKMCHTAGESLGLQCSGNTGLKLRKVIEQLQFKG